jgi:hypothetical protein
MSRQGFERYGLISSTITKRFEIITRVRSVAILAVLTAVAETLSAQQSVSTRVAHGSLPKMELRILPGQLDRGLPETFTFVFVNRSGHQLRIPRPTQCKGGNGTVILRSKFKPLNTLGVPSGGGGGCGGGLAGKIQVLQWAKSWQSLNPGASLSISYSRRDLFNFQEDAGDYEFWGEYEPPILTIEDVLVLERAGIRFPRVPLTSKHVQFKRLN